MAAVTLVSFLLPAAACAGGEFAGSTPPDDARAWLTRIHAAANTGNYRGTMVFSASGAMSSSRVWHYCVGDQTFEKLESLDGLRKNIYRHNDDVHTLWPQTRTAVVEKRSTLAGWQTTPQAVEPRVLEQYQLRREGESRVAGRDADVFLLEPRDTLRYAQRLWADQATGLMLRADVLALGPERAVLESAAFSEVEIGVKPQPKTVTQAVASLDGYRVVRPRQQRTRLEDEGWVLTKPVAGFNLTGCIKRQLEATRQDPRAPDAVVQAVFSDGLAHVSLFIEPFDPQRHRDQAQAHLGATATVTVRRQDHWITAVGDAPMATLRLLTEAIERRR
ncbi:MAG: MucB/RseB C-terminal domain-containing protein [Chitinophagaceae bacterium]|nr:MucB/RseB C-terminal domain-containing protein [Rubrivivax sp.]